MNKTAQGTRIILLPSNEVCKRLGITPITLYTWVREGRIRGSKVGRYWRFREDEVLALQGDLVRD